MNTEPSPGGHQAEQIRQAASEVRWMWTLLVLHLRSLARCVDPGRRRNHEFGNLTERQAYAAKLLGEINLDTGRLLRGLDDVRRATRTFIADEHPGGKKTTENAP